MQNPWIVLQVLRNFSTETLQFSQILWIRRISENLDIITSPIVLNVGWEFPISSTFEVNFIRASRGKTRFKPKVFVKINSFAIYLSNTDTWNLIAYTKCERKSLFYILFRCKNHDTTLRWNFISPLYFIYNFLAFFLSQCFSRTRNLLTPQPLSWQTFTNSSLTFLTALLTHLIYRHAIFFLRLDTKVFIPAFSNIALSGA